MVSARIEELFGEELARGVPVFAGGRAVVDTTALTDDETKAVRRCISDYVEHLNLVCPTLATTVKNQESFLLKAAQVAKASFTSPKPLRYPSEPGAAGVMPLIPQALKWVASPNVDNPCYTSFKTNLWEIDLTAGTTTYLLGDGTNYYRTSKTKDQVSLIALPKDCLVEIGSTPKLSQFRVYTEIQKKYGPYAVEPLIEVPIVSDKVIYQYPTLGSVLLAKDLGTMWEAMPTYSGTSRLMLLGLVFFEHDFMPTLKWVA
jgi:hypothetical protein